MIEWNFFKNSLAKNENINEFFTKIENTTFNILKKIFPNAQITKENRTILRTIYDFLVESNDIKLYCEIKLEKISLQRFWKNQILSISNQLLISNKEKRKWKRLKFLLILIESEDSIAKMNLNPIYPDILVINLKMLFKIRNFLVHQNRDYVNLFENIIRESSGVLYDSFIMDSLEILGNIHPSNIEKIIDLLHIDNYLLKLNKKNLIKFYERKREMENTKIIKKILKLAYKKQIEISKYEIAKKLNINIEDAKYYYDLIRTPKYYLQIEEKKIDFEGEQVLKKIKQPTLFDLICNFGYNLTLAKQIGKYLIDKGLIINFPELPEKKIKCQIILLSLDENLTGAYEDYLINLLIENKFKAEKITDFYDIDDILERIKVANIIIVDLTNNNPNIIYLVGRTHRMRDSNTVIQICQINQEIPQLLEKYKTFFYMKPIEADNKFQYELLNYIENICGKY